MFLLIFNTNNINIHIERYLIKGFNGVTTLS